MAAGKDQPEPVIVHVRIRLLLLLQVLGARLKPLEALEDLLLQLQRPGTAKAIDRLVPGDPGDPGARVVRDPVARPALQCDDERLLDRLLGGVEIPEDPDQTGDRPSRLVPEQAVDSLGRPLYDVAGVAPASAGSS
jgi:hypothetical protein